MIIPGCTPLYETLDVDVSLHLGNDNAQAVSSLAEPGPIRVREGVAPRGSSLRGCARFDRM